MFKSLSQYVKSVTLASRNVGGFEGEEAADSGFRTIELVGLADRNRIVREFMTDCRDRGTSCIVHETFYGLAFPAAALSDLSSRFHRRVLSLYVPNPSYFLRWQWLRTGKEHVSLSEYLHHINLFGRRMLWELPSCYLANGIVCNSDDIRKGLEALYRVPSGKAITLPTEVDTDHFYPRDVRKEDFGFETTQRIVLYVGSLQARKGIYTLLRASAMLRSRLPSFTIVCAGQLDPYDRKHFLNSMHSLGVEDHYLLLDSVKRADLPIWYSLADVLVCPSLAEGSPRVIKEAASCGCPIVATDLAGTRLIDTRGEYVRLIPANDPDSLADQIELVLRDDELRNHMRGTGRSIMERDFTPQRIAERLVGYYDTLWT